MNNQKVEQLYKKLLLEENAHNLSWEHYLIASFLVMLSKSNNNNSVKILFVNNQGEQLITYQVDENNRLDDIADEIKSICSQHNEQDSGNYDAVLFLNVSNFYTKRIMDQSKDGDYFFVCKTENDNLQYYITTKNAVPSFDTILTKRYEKILEELSANDKTIKQITSYGEGEEELIKKLEGGKCSDIPSVTFHELFESQVKKHADEPAIICGATSISYNELNKKANQIARYINEYISGKENLIGILMERSIDFIASILGIIKSGNGYIPIDSDTLNPGHDSLPKKRLDFMLKDANMPLVITNNKFAKELKNSEIQVLNIDSGLTKAYEVENLDIDISNDNIIYGIYTSGSTGYPKLTIVEHKSVINLFGSLEQYIYRNTVKQGSYRVSQNAPFGFDASVQQFIALTRGDCLCILPECVRHSTNGIINYINNTGIDILDCTPSQLELLISAGIFEKCAEHLKCVLLGGEEVPEKMWNIIRNLDDIRVFNVYGPTECTVDSTFTLINGNNYSYPVIGRPIDNCKISIVDEDGNRVPIGSWGEIHIFGYGVARGYLNRDELNQKCFHTKLNEQDEIERSYCSGDIAKFLPDGTIVFGGRRDSQVKIRSHRIELAEITTILNKHDNILSSLVVVDDSSSYKTLIAYLKLENDMKFDPIEIAEFLSQYVPQYMLPNHYISIKDWPLTANMKIDKKSLPKPEELINQKKDIDKNTIDNLQSEITELFKNILAINNIGINDSFMKLGGDSLRVMTLLAQVFDKYDVEIDFADFFENSTIAYLMGELTVHRSKNVCGNCKGGCR